ncbi:MAG: response regulator, partial [Gemmatimonadota bacterium]
RVTEPETAEAPWTALRVAADSATVLLVEDDEPVRRLIADVLERRGLHVLSARDGADAVRICESHEGAIDLLVTDVVMPDVSGLDLSQQLSVLRPEMRVLYVSGYADQALIDRGLLEAAVSFLPKPFTLDGLVRKVWEVLARPRKGPQTPVR